MATQNPIPSPQSPAPDVTCNETAEVLNMLDQVSDRIGALSQRLPDRLSIVSRPSSPEAACGETCRAFESPLAQNISSVIYRIEASLSVLQDAEDRLEV